MTLEERLGLLDEALEIGDDLGIATRAARDRMAEGRKRLGFTGEVYVIALLGGTGVGKSSLLNSLAGERVSEASAIRPTTSSPVAYVAESSLGEVQPLLEWLETGRTVTHSREEMAAVAMLDLPDFDSIAIEHRAQVDRLLPRVDVVIWVVDPEKYDDERLFGYLREMAPRIPEIRVLLNKIDHLSPAERAAVRDDLTTRLSLLGIRTELHLVSAATGAGVEEVRGRILADADAKREIASRIRTEADAALLDLARAAGVGPDGSFERLITDEAAAEATDQATRAALDILDPERLVVQVRNSYLERSKARAGSLVGRIGSLLRFTVGHRRRHADPAVFLRSWRSRGDIGRAVNPIRAIYLKATERLGPEARARLLTGFDADASRTALTAAMDRAASTTSKTLTNPSTWVVSVLTPLQWVATAGFIGAVVWLVLLIVGPGGTPVGEVDLPYLGPTPAPLALLFGSALISVVLGLLARFHASWVGRRRGRALEQTLREEVGGAVREEAFRPLEELEKRRVRLAEIVAMSTNARAD
jgi:GTP-binding protein EngB required for normal cell division/nitrate reductase NapE component